MKKIVFLCMVMVCGLYGLSGMAEPSVKLPEILPAKPMTPLRPTVEELNKAKEREATALREKEKADAEIARLQKELAKKPKEANPPPAPSAVTVALDWVNQFFFKNTTLNIIAFFLITSLFIYIYLRKDGDDFELALGRAFLFFNICPSIYLCVYILQYLEVVKNHNSFLTLILIPFLWVFLWFFLNFLYIGVYEILYEPFNKSRIWIIEKRNSR